MELDDIVNKFGNIYTTQIVPKLAVFENKRQQKLKKYKIVKYAQYIVTALFVIALLPFFKFYVGVNGFDKSSCDMLKLIFGLGITAITLIYTWATKIDKDFRNSMKKDMFPIVLQPFGKFKVLNNSERKDKLITLNDIKSLKLYTRAERQSNDDVITGKYKDNEISIVEAELEHTEGSGKHSHTVIDFSGIILKAQLNKKYSGDYTILHHKNSRSERPSGLQKVVLEDVELNKIYNVYSDDQVEVRYLLDLTFMEKFKEALDTFNASYIDFVIHDNNFYMFISSYHDFFEICSIDKVVYDVNQFRNAAREFASVFKLIEHFELVKEKNNA